MTHIELNLLKVISTCPNGISRAGILAADYLYGDERVVEPLLSGDSSILGKADATILVHVDSSWFASANILQAYGVRGEPLLQVCIQAEDASAQIEAFLRKLGGEFPEGIVLNLIGPEERLDLTIAEYAFRLFLQLFGRLGTTQIQFPIRPLEKEEAFGIRDPFMVWDRLEKIKAIQSGDFILPKNLESFV